MECIYLHFFKATEGKWGFTINVHFGYYYCKYVRKFDIDYMIFRNRWNFQKSTLFSQGKLKNLMEYLGKYHYFVKMESSKLIN